MEETRKMVNDLALIKGEDKEFLLKMASEMAPESQMMRDMIKGEWDKSKEKISHQKKILREQKKNEAWIQKMKNSIGTNNNMSERGRSSRVSENYNELAGELRKMGIITEYRGWKGQVLIPPHVIPFLMDSIRESKENFMDKLDIRDEILVPNIFPEDVSEDELGEDHDFIEIDFEGVDYLEDEETGEIFTTFHRMVGKWNALMDDIIWANDSARINHESKKD